MPYISPGARAELITEPKRASTVGDYNFLFSRAYLKAFIAEPKYSTIHLIRQASIIPKFIKEVEAVENLLEVQNVSIFDRATARDLAFQEFYRRIGSLAEDQAIIRNGDVEAFKEAEQAILERTLKGN